MNNLKLPVPHTGKQILDNEGGHVADCASNEAAAEMVVVINQHSRLRRIAGWYCCKVAGGFGQSEYFEDTLDKRVDELIKITKR